MIRSRLVIIAISIVVLFISCKSDYTKLVEGEMKKGASPLELPLGLTTGISKKDYFAQCWQLNSDKKISHGPGNQYAKFELTPLDSRDSLHKITMLFYGLFDKDEIMHGLDMRMEFNAWAPWNEDSHSPELIKTLQRHYLESYGGNPFMSLDVTEDLQAQVKVDKNRRITIYPLSGKEVVVKIIDLRYENDIVKK